MVRLRYLGTRTFKGRGRMPGVVLKKNDLIDVPEDLAEELVATGRFEQLKEKEDE